MGLFKKRLKVQDGLLRQMQEEHEEMRLEFESLKRNFDKLENGMRALVREELLHLARNESIYTVTLYRDEEFLTKVYVDRLKELKCKKRKLEQAIIDCDIALKEVSKEVK